MHLPTGAQESPREPQNPKGPNPMAMASVCSERGAQGRLQGSGQKGVCFVSKTNAASEPEHKDDVCAVTQGSCLGEIRCQEQQKSDVLK